MSGPRFKPKKAAGSVIMGPCQVNEWEDTSMLDVGSPAPSIKLKSHEGEEISLEQYRGKWVVLHTFPLSFTGG